MMDALTVLAIFGMFYAVGSAALAMGAGSPDAARWARAARRR